MNHHSIHFWRMWLAVVVAAAFVFGAAVSIAEEEKSEEAEKPKIHVEQWLQLGPFDAPFPAFNDEDYDKKMKAGDLLAFEHMGLADLWPVAGDKVRLIEDGDIEWTTASAPDTLGVLIPAKEGPPRVAYLAAYVNVPQWMKVDVAARSTQPFELIIDGESVVKNKKGGEMASDKAKSGDAKLEMGRHLMVVKTVYVPGDSLVEWRVDVNVSAGEDFDVDPEVTLDPQRRMKIWDVLDGPSVGSVRVSPDGSMFLVTMSERTCPEWEAGSGRRRATGCLS
jgi:hypothetical protein